MAEVITNTQKMTDAFVGVGTEAINRANHAKEKITIIDNEKRAFDDAISNLDQVLLQQIEDTNDTLEKVEQEYANRIDVVGCRSDLFWSCLLYTSPSPRDGLLSRMPSSA